MKIAQSHQRHLHVLTK